MTVKSIAWIKRKAIACLLEGVSPQRLALTLALGFAIGCIPVFGVTTALCALLALTLRLNFPAIQAANWAAAPLQVVLIVPFVRLGGRLFSFDSGRALGTGAWLHTQPLVLLARLSGWTAQALLAWLLIAIPAVALMTATLTIVLRRVPAVTAVQSAD